MNTHLIEDFKLHYPDKSVLTMETYAKAIKDFYAFMQDRYKYATEEEIIIKANWSTCQLFRNNLINKELHPKTINVYLSGLRTFFSFLVKSRKIGENPFQEVESVSTKSVAEYERPYLEGNEFEQLLEATRLEIVGKKQDNFDLTSTRDSLAVGIMLKAGLRISELLSIKADDIDENTGRVKIVGKGNKVREVVIGTDNLQRLREYKYVRQSYAQTEYLFVNRYGKHITRQAMHKNLKSYLDRAGLDLEISCHGLRKSCASDLLRKGVRPTQVAQLLGHSNLETTLKHYAKESSEFDFID